MGRGWSKENYKDILGRKYVDKSILKYGTVIPLKLTNIFLIIYQKIKFYWENQNI